MPKVCSTTLKFARFRSQNSKQKSRNGSGSQDTILTEDTGTRLCLYERPDMSTSIDDGVAAPAAAGMDKENVVSNDGVRGQDATTQTPVKMGRVASSMDKESWKDWDKGRATFRPPASELGRPVFHPDAEEAESRLRQLKQDVRRADEERDLAKTHLLRAEKEIKRRDHRLFKELEEHQQAGMLPGRLEKLVKDCLKSGLAEELTLLREKLAAPAIAGTAATGRMPVRISAVETGDPGTPRAKLAGRFEEDPAASPLRRQGSSLSKGGSTRNLVGGGGGGGGEALQTARAELERLQKLCAAHEVIREGLEKRVAHLEAHQQRTTTTADGVPVATAAATSGAAIVAGGERESTQGAASLYTEDGRGFDNYIRRLAGLTQLPATETATHQHLDVRVGTETKGKRRPAVQMQGSKGDAEVVYEVTCHTTDMPGAGTRYLCVCVYVCVSLCVHMCSYMYISLSTYTYITCMNTLTHTAAPTATSHCEARAANLGHVRSTAQMPIPLCLVSACWQQGARMCLTLWRLTWSHCTLSWYPLTCLAPPRRGT